MKLSSLVLVSALAIAGLNVSASVFDESVDSVELANALLNCPMDMTNLKFASVDGEINYISSVSGRFAQVSTDVSVKTYTIVLASSVGGLEGVETIRGKVEMELKLTQNDYAGPATAKWTCSIF